MCLLKPGSSYPLVCHSIRDDCLPETRPFLNHLSCSLNLVLRSCFPSEIWVYLARKTTKASCSRLARTGYRPGFPLFVRIAMGGVC